MKKKLLTAVAVLASLCGYAQTKGTSTLGLGVSISTSKQQDNSSTYSQERVTKNNSFSLGYGLFIRDNTRIGIDLNYGNSDNGNSSAEKTKTYGGSLTYQQYYPLIKKLYAYAGGRAGYGYTKYTGNSGDFPSVVNADQYSVGAYGGITWFVSKRFAFETTLLSANAVYASYKQKINDSSISTTKQTNFNLTTQGFINDLGFKIYLLF